MQPAWLSQLQHLERQVQVRLWLSVTGLMETLSGWLVPSWLSCIILGVHSTVLGVHVCVRIPLSRERRALPEPSASGPHGLELLGWPEVPLP